VLVVTIAGLLVLALATTTDTARVREPSGDGRVERSARAQALIQAGRREGNALIETPLASRLAALKGVPVVVNQWASWCPPCRSEFPFFAAMAECYSRDVAFLGLNSRDERAPPRPSSRRTRSAIRASSISMPSRRARSEPAGSRRTVAPAVPPGLCLAERAPRVRGKTFIGDGRRSTVWARVAAFDGTDVERARAEAGRRPPDELIPAGLRGVLSLMDAESGRQLFITLFDTRDQIEAAEPPFERMGDEIPEALRGRRVSRDYYEVAAGVVALAGEMR
jgi:thiol-disulfide isomerase/thioredoxin